MIQTNTLPAEKVGFEEILADQKIALERTTPRLLQINAGRLCNLTCIHCHVNAGPSRREIMTDETVDRVLDWYEKTDIPFVDLTGGAPEMIPGFRRLVETVSAMRPQRHIMDRCNLTILLEPGYEDLATFLARHRVEVVASMPCYEAENVNAQRGEGVFDASIEALQMLNSLGYGIDENLPLDLVYNPLGAALPPDQEELEADYKREFRTHFGIEFNNLYTITNMPIARFASWLRRNDRLDEYQRLLVDNFNPSSVTGLMCRDTISIDWLGNVYDCDFNQQLGMGTVANKIWDLALSTFADVPIRTGSHCFGCTAGAGSSCGGALT